MLRVAPGASLLCREFRWGDPSKKISRKLKLGGGKVFRAQWLAMSGGKDGPVLALLCAQTRDLDGDHGVSRCDVVSVGERSDQDVSRPWSDAGPIYGGPARLLEGAAVPFGERCSHE